MGKKKRSSQNQAVPATLSLELSPRKKRIFMIVMLGLPALVILLLELGLRIGGYGEDMRLFVSTPDESSPYLGMNMRAARRYYYYYGEKFDPKPRKDLFLKQKPAHGYRIFVLGASTTAGFPYGNNISFARVLHRRLVDAFPERLIEVVNTAITSVNSYTLLDFIDEILAQQPDAILIYAGHNEYYGPFGPSAKVALGKYPRVAKTILRLQRYKTFLLIRDAVGAGVRALTWQQAVSETSAKSQNKIDQAFFRKTAIPIDSREYRVGLKQYHDNLRAILKKARQANVPVLLSELISNVRDQRPFPTLEPDSVYPAMQMYRQAQSLERNGQFDAARDAYYRAKDLDPIRFRSPEAFNDLIHALCAEFALPVVPMKSYFEHRSPNGLIGDNLLLEHVHPTVHGYFLMADAFYQVMRSRRMISDLWPAPADDASEHYEKSWGITPLDSLYARLVLLNLTSGWPFTTKQFSSIAARQSVIDRFPVRTIVDSIALKTYMEPEYSIQSAHFDLAQFYETHGQPELALAEYKALIYSIPSMDMFYEHAVRILMDSKQYQRAYELLRDGVKYHDSAFLTKWLGQVCLLQNQLRDGINYLNQSLTLAPNDEQVLFNLARAYFMVTDFERGDGIVKKLATLNPKNLAIQQLTVFRSTIQAKLAQASPFIREANAFFKQKQYNKAAQSLKHSIDIYDTSIAEEMLGIRYLQEKQTGQAIPYLKKADQLRSDIKADILYNLSVAYVITGQPNDALQAYVQLQQADPDFKNSDQLKAQIGKLVGM